MASNSSFQSDICLVWKTKFLPCGMQLESRKFDFMKSKWYLRITSSYTQSTGHLLNLQLMNSKRQNPCKSFQVRTYLEHDVHRLSMFCSRRDVSSGFATLCSEKFDVIKEKLSLDNDELLVITCVISSSHAEFLYLSREKADKSSQSSLHCLGQNSVAPVASGVDGTSVKSTKLSLKPMLHLQTLSEDMGDMLQRSIMTDVQLKCGGEVIPAHKAVLSSRSNVFSSMFQHEMVESINNTVDLSDIEPSTLREFLRYLYTGTFSEDLPAEVITKLYETSDKYAVHTLQEECAHIMINKLNEENFIHFLVLSDEHSDPNLTDAIANFIIRRPVLLTLDTWMKFCDDFPKTANEIYKKYTKHRHRTSRTPDYDYFDKCLMRIISN